MFNDDFFELKKALEVVTIEATDLKNKLHQKEAQISNLRATNKASENNNLRNKIHELQKKIIEKDIQIRELKSDKESDNRTISKLRDKAQGFTAVCI